jgi:hypothetical protein
MMLRDAGDTLSTLDDPLGCVGVCVGVGVVYLVFVLVEPPLEGSKSF